MLISLFMLTGINRRIECSSCLLAACLISILYLDWKGTLHYIAAKPSLHGTLKTLNPIKSSSPRHWQLNLAFNINICTVPAVSWQPWCSACPLLASRLYIGSQGLALFLHFALWRDYLPPVKRPHRHIKIQKRIVENKWWHIWHSNPTKSYI